MKWIITPNSLKIKYYRWFNKLYFRMKGIEFGKNMLAYNKVYLTGYKQGRITIGDDFHLTSGDGINPICRNIRACIHRGRPNAVITIGNYVGMSSPCILINERLTIGDHVKIGGNCVIFDTDTHQIDYLARRGDVNVRLARSDASLAKNANVNGAEQMVQTAPVTIEDDVWIGASSIILKGVTIGARSIIGAGSMVTKSIPADSIAAGNPCKVIRKIENCDDNEAKR